MHILKKAVIISAATLLAVSAFADDTLNNGIFSGHINTNKASSPVNALKIWQNYNPIKLGAKPGFIRGIIKGNTYRDESESNGSVKYVLKGNQGAYTKLCVTGADDDNWLGVVNFVNVAGFINPKASISSKCLSLTKVSGDKYTVSPYTVTVRSPGTGILPLAKFEFTGVQINATATSVQTYPAVSGGVVGKEGKNVGGVMPGFLAKALFDGNPRFTFSAK